MKKLALALLLSLAVAASAVALPAAAAPGGKGGGGSGDGGSSGPNDSDLPGPRWPVNGLAPSDSDNAVLKWDEELLQTIRANPGATGPTITSRAIGVLHTAMFDAWAPYDATAVGVHSRLGRRETAERTLANKQEAVSHAAHTVLVDLFPAAEADFVAQMTELGYTVGADTGPAADGRAAAAGVLDYRHSDGSNQSNGYTDTTGYTPANGWDSVVDPWLWQPLCVPLPAPDATSCAGNVQRPLTPQWGEIDGFALGDPGAPGQPMSLDDPASTLFYPPSPADPEGDTALALTDTANLTDTQKVKAEYWADGPESEFPPGHWAVLAQAVSRKRGHSLDDDVKLFFALGNAVMDAGVGAWHAKYKYDFARPITAIREQFAGQMVTSWLGPYNGYGKVPGEQWRPYQDPHVVTPPFPEYVSGHSTFSAAAHMVLAAFTGSDAFRAKVTIPAGSSLFEPRTATAAGTPAKDVVLSWNTLTDAADEAGWSRRWGGIHFKGGDEHGRAFGKAIGYAVWQRAQTYLDGSGVQVITN
ncbi:MAG TPA: vanadium-dependent haloperoxidase [Euzebyales bacterium]|nr:vanadium-dependent haloperoxidase [Euzebyales bacterium]